jgi:hypothetical protein
LPRALEVQLQTEIALSSTESEYTGLSYELRDAIPIMQLMKEMRRNGVPILSPIFFNLLEHFEASPIFSKFLQSFPIYVLLEISFSNFLVFSHFLLLDV